MRAISFLGCCLISLCLACNEGGNQDRTDHGQTQNSADVDLTTPGRICEIHGLPLEEGVVPIIYGLNRPTQEEIEAKYKLFPHAASFYNRGCVVKEPQRALVSFCPECRKAEAKWENDPERKMTPIRAQWDRVQELVQQNAKFEKVHLYMLRGNSPTVGIEGQVKTFEDLAELRRLVAATNPPQPVQWSVQVSP